MIFISKAVSVFFLPPGCFVIALILLTIFTVPKRFKILLALVTLLLYAFSIQPVSDFLLKPLEDAYTPVTSSPSLKVENIKDWPQAIVVLGGGVIQSSPEAEGGHDALSSDAMKRALYAFTLRSWFKAPIVFSGGKVFENDQEAEAVTAGRLYESLGLPSSRFIAETESRNTWENAQEAGKLGFKRVILVTSAYHMKRGIYCFEKNGIEAIPAPTDYKTDCGRKYDVFSYLPAMNYLRNTYLALHEYIGLLYYVIFYK